MGMGAGMRGLRMGKITRNAGSGIWGEVRRRVRPKGAPRCFVEVFILMGLRGVCFVSVVNARVTGAHLRQESKILKNGVDSIGVAGGDV